MSDDPQPRSLPLLYSSLTVTVEDDDKRGPGGAPHRYRITGFDTAGNPTAVDRHGYLSSFSSLPVVFQCGGLADNSPNGVTHEALLAIVADRLQCFQAGPYPAPENAEALQHIEQAIAALDRRTRDRQQRGVEGRLQV